MAPHQLTQSLLAVLVHLSAVEEAMVAATEVGSAAEVAMLMEAALETLVVVAALLEAVGPALKMELVPKWCWLMAKWHWWME